MAKTNSFGFKSRIILVSLVSFLLVFLFYKLVLYFTSSNYFSVLDLKQVFSSFLYGIRFDINVIAVFLFPLFIILSFPIRNRIFIKTISFLICTIFLAMSLFLAADIVFFSLFNNHIGVEILTSLTHFGLFAQLAFSTYWYATFPILIIFAGTLYAINRMVDKAVFEPDRNFARNSIIAVLVLSLLGFFGIKGRLSFHGRPLGIIDSQALGSAQTADLMLNGIFTAWDAIRHNRKRNIFLSENYYRPEISANEYVPDENYPFERIRNVFNIPNRNYNFVLIILESMDPMVLDEYREAAPNLNHIRENSIYFPNFYSSGTRSLLGCGSTLFSMPYIWGVPTLNNGLAAKNLSRMAEIFKKEGYETINVITDSAMSDKAIKLASYMGFDSFFAKEDIPVKRKYPMFNKGFDYEGFEFFIDKADSFNGRKFLAYFYTSSTHNPYDIVLSEEHVRYDRNSVMGQFLNRVLYADDALGNFFRIAETRPWFKDTIFLLLPDHRAPLPDREIIPDIAKMKYDSYLLVYAPHIFKPETNDIIATQEDVLPTLLDMLNSHESYASAGQSLFDKDRSRTKYIYSENRETFILSPEGNSWFREPQSVEAVSRMTEEEKKAISFGETAYRAMRDNRWKKKL